MHIAFWYCLNQDKKYSELKLRSKLLNLLKRIIFLKTTFLVIKKMYKRYEDVP